MKSRLKLSPNLADIYYMEAGDKNLAKLKKHYLNLVLKISKFRAEGAEPPFELIIQAHKVGRLAHIPESHLYKLLRG